MKRMKIKDPISNELVQSHYLSFWPESIWMLYYLNATLFEWHASEKGMSLILSLNIIVILEHSLILFNKMGGCRKSTDHLSRVMSSTMIASEAAM